MVAEDLSRIAMSSALANSLARAVDFARAQAHLEVTLEHMLVLLCEDPDAGLVLAASNIDVGRLKADAAGYLARLGQQPVPPGQHIEPVVSMDLRRILEAAAAAARGGRRREINGAIVLAAIVGDGKSPAAQMLQAQGLTFEGVIRALQSGAGVPARPYPPPSTEDILATARERVLSRTGIRPEAEPAVLEEEEAAAAEEYVDFDDVPPTGAHAPETLAEEVREPEPEPVQASEPRPELQPPPEPQAERDAAEIAEAPKPAVEWSPPVEATGEPASPEDLRMQPEPIVAPKEAPTFSVDALPMRPPPPMPPPIPGAEPSPSRAPPPGAAPSAPPPLPAGRIGGEAPPAARPSLSRWPGTEELRKPKGVGAAAGGAAARSGLAHARQTLPRSVPDLQPSGRPAPAPRTEIGQLVENIPRSMRVAVPSLVEVRIARGNVQALAEGLQGGGAAYRHDVTITKAMSVRLRAPDGGFFIEAASPETQWIEKATLLSSDDYASWRWHVTPRERGRKRLQLIISARTVSGDGLAAETALPDQVITVRVRANYAKVASHWFGWGVAAVIGGLLARFGESALDAGMKVVAALSSG